MTCDERLGILLNLAGQTISDLPKAYSYDQMIQANKQVEDYLATLCPEDPIRNEPENFLWYILHLTDIIDRMELALENVIGERDWLARKFVCVYCKHCENDIDSEPCKSCYAEAINDPPGYEFDEDKPIVPEDWSADDD